MLDPWERLFACFCGRTKADQHAACALDRNRKLEKSCEREARAAVLDDLRGQPEAQDKSKKS